MSVADRDRLVFEEYAGLGRHLSGVWRRERFRCVVCRWGRCLLVGFARSGLAMIGINPYEVQGLKSGPAGGRRTG
ncbi:MAG: hypothetical protein AUG49_00440 [Catenulispora sp. 13_1_20CM_3_70_7]|nr:hypothetical protein [Catenulisporales bacterium]OLE29113.1 MAG: hypothetical protein AUG49_00440 [Catenulispora sp. 13_1_20CM_3_70_7]